MNDDLLYSGISSNSDFFTTYSNIDYIKHGMKNEKTTDLNNHITVRRYFPETWIWASKEAEYAFS